MQKCCYCETKLTGRVVATIEHIVPRSKGGKEIGENKRPCCFQCNSWRGNKSLNYWRSEIVELLNDNRVRPPFSRQDLIDIVKNIELIAEFIRNNEKLLRKKNNKAFHV